MADRGERELVASEDGVEPSCPVCGHYNAMLFDSSRHYNEIDRAHKEGRDTSDFAEYRKCRDCGATGRLAIPRSN